MTEKETVFYYGNEIKFSISDTIKTYIEDTCGHDAFQHFKNTISSAFQEISKCTNMTTRYVDYHAKDKKTFEIKIMPKNDNNALVAQIHRNFIEKININQTDLIRYNRTEKQYFDTIIHNKGYGEILTEEEINSLFLFNRLPYSNLYNKNFFKINKYIIGGEIELKAEIIQDFLYAWQEKQDNNQTLNEKKHYLKTVILHEIGHGLGFKHTHTNLDDPSNPYQDFTKTTDYSVMSYLTMPHTKSQTFMMGDVEKILYFLKPNTNYSKGNDLYTLQDNTIENIYDWDGNDTLISRQDRDIHIDIRKGYYSGYYTQTSPENTKVIYNMSIHPTTEIENAIALNNGHRTTLIGNHLSNILIGGNVENCIFANGDEITQKSIIHKQKKDYQTLQPTIEYHDQDTILTGDKNDFIMAGLGNDIVSAGAGNDIIQLGDGNDLCLAAEGNDRIESYNNNTHETHNISFAKEKGDIIFAEDGKDHIVARGGDFIHAGYGNDQIEYTFHKQKIGQIITDYGYDIITINRPQNAQSGTLIIHDFNDDKIIFAGENKEITSFSELLRYAQQGYVENIHNDIYWREPIDLEKIPKKSTIYRKIFKKIEDILPKNIITELVDKDIIRIPLYKRAEFYQNTHPTAENTQPNQINNYVTNITPQTDILTVIPQHDIIEEILNIIDAPHNQNQRHNQTPHHTEPDPEPQAFITGMPPIDMTHIMPVRVPSAEQTPNPTQPTQPQNNRTETPNHPISQNNQNNANPIQEDTIQEENAQTDLNHNTHREHHANPATTEQNTSNDHQNKEKYTLIDTTYYENGQDKGYKLILLGVGITDLKPTDFIFINDNTPLDDVGLV